MKRKAIALLIAILATSTVFVSCGDKDKGGTEGNSSQEESLKNQASTEKIKATNPDANPKAAKERKDTLIVSMSAPKGEFNPIYSSTLYDGWVSDLVFEGLMTNDAKGKIIPNIAKEWNLSEDGKTYTFKLNEGIKFSNGEELTTEDVAFTFTAAADPSYDGPRSYFVEPLEGYKEYNKGAAEEISGIKIIDKYNIEFTLKEPNAAYIENFIAGIMPKNVYGFEKGNFQKVKDKLLQPIGSGPYKFVHFKPGEEVKFEKNSSYWKAEPKIPYIVMKTTNASTLVQELISGSIDIDTQIAARPENIDPMKEAGFLNLDLYPANSYGYIGLNLESPKLSDPAVREALTVGLNRKGFMDTYYSGYGTVLNSHILTTSWAYNPDVPKYEYNPEKAKEILDNAGWVDSNGDGVRDKDGVELNISWLTHTNSKYVDTLIPIVKECWDAIGIKVTPEIMEFATMASKVRNDREFEIYNMAWSLSIDPDPSGIFAISQDVPGGYNSNRWRNEKADKLMSDALITNNQDERKELYYKWQEEFSKDLPYILIGAAKELAVSNSRVKNFNPSTYMKWTTNIHEVELND